ncbi:MAG: nickel pincer cofactor biosynthesis protein LarC [Chloroflexi bacterium]|nr:nickel pincer cofactor biosynthesis protein LarC [Chloroflexota bacterium]
MVLGALVDAGVPVATLRSHLAKLGQSGYTLEAREVVQQGFRGTQAVVTVSEPQPARRLVDIIAIVEQSPLPPEVKALACRIFRRLGEAEARVHGRDAEHAHLHEVGAVDAIVDIVGAVLGLHLLGVESVFASPIATGSGLVQCAHGTVPVPAPATLALLEEVEAPILPGRIQCELATPTGAAILTTLATFSPPAVQVQRVGYGFGQKQLPWPNALRLILGTGLAQDLQADGVSIIEANVDDMTPELLGAAMEVLLDAGALDVYFSPIQMKKNRPAVKLSAIAPVELEGKLAELVLLHTTSLGVRIKSARRLKCARWQESVDTPWGPVRVKVRSFRGKKSAAPEYDDCLRVAREHGLPVLEVYTAVNTLARAQP